MLGAWGEPWGVLDQTELEDGTGCLRCDVQGLSSEDVERDETS
jgi:hypothetical protein